MFNYNTIQLKELYAVESIFNLANSGNISGLSYLLVKCFSVYFNCVCQFPHKFAANDIKMRLNYAHWLCKTCFCIKCWNLLSDFRMPAYIINFRLQLQLKRNTETVILIMTIAHWLSSWFDEFVSSGRPCHCNYIT